MSSPSDRFECRWRASTGLRAAYAASQASAWLALYCLALPVAVTLPLVIACLAHGCWVWPRSIGLNHPAAFTGLRRTAPGWELWSEAGGWQAVQLRPDSLALPALVVLRFRLAGEWRVRGLCIPHDAMAPEQFRRFRLRLKFSRRRWAAAK